MILKLRQLIAVSALAIGISDGHSAAHAAVVTWNFEGAWTTATDIADPGTFSGSLSYDDAAPGIDTSGPDFSFFTYEGAQLTSLTSFGSTFGSGLPPTSAVRLSPTIRSFKDEPDAAATRSMRLRRISS